MAAVILRVNKTSAVSILNTGLCAEALLTKPGPALETSQQPESTVNECESFHTQTQTKMAH